MSFVLLEILLPKEGYPLWLVIVSALIAILGIFWTRIKSTFELFVKGKQDQSIKEVEHDLKIKVKKFDNDAKEKESISKRIEFLEKQNKRLTKSNTALSMAMLFMIDKYEKSNPEDTTVITEAKRLIKENLYESEDKAH